MGGLCRKRTSSRGGCRVLLAISTLRKKSALLGFFVKNLTMLIVILFLNPFGLKDYTDNYTQAMIARMAAPFYGDSGQKQVVVVEINDQVLKSTSKSWPITYGHHARLLRRILSYKPKAVFVDFLYSQNRDPQGLKGLVRLLKKHNNPAGKSPVYIADFVTENGSVLLPELQEGVLTARVNWSHYGDQYPLEITENGQSWETPATSLYKIFCRSHECFSSIDQESEPMTLYWGVRTDPLMKYVVGDNHGCREHDPGLLGSIREASRLAMAKSHQGLYSSREFEHETMQKCPYSRYIFANQLSPRSDTAEALITDKIVVLGGIFRGIPDYISSPVHGQLPGMYMHAMAADNLITLQENYMKEPGEIPGFASLDWADVIEIVMVFGILVFFVMAAKKGWLDTFKRKIFFGVVIVCLDICTALIMSLYLNYSPVNVLAILFLSLYALTLAGDDDLRLSLKKT